MPQERDATKTHIGLTEPEMETVSREEKLSVSI